MIRGADVLGRHTVRFLCDAQADALLLIGERDLATAKDAAAPLRHAVAVTLDLDCDDFGFREHPVGAVAVLFTADRVTVLRSALD